jgi:hypothetical protein
MIQNLMMERARLGTARGSATVWIRKQPEGSDHRGSFWFRAEYEDEIQHLVRVGAPVELVGWVAGEWRSLTTRLLSAPPGTGLAIFEGAGELRSLENLGRDAAG